SDDWPELFGDGGRRLSLQPAWAGDGLASQRQRPGDGGGCPPGGPPGRVRRMAAPVLCPWRASGTRLGPCVDVGAYTAPPAGWRGLLGHPRVDGGGERRGVVGAGGQRSAGHGL